MFDANDYMASSTEAQAASQILDNLDRAFIKLETVLEFSEEQKEPNVPHDASDQEKIAMLDSTLIVLRKNQKIIENALKSVQSESDSFQKAARAAFGQDENILENKILT